MPTTGISERPGRGAVRRLRTSGGYAMAALLVTLAIMAIILTIALPTYRHQMQREKEAELVFRGEQYARAIGLFQRKFAGAFPPSIDVLVQQKFLRKKYKDPMTKDGEFQVLYQGSAGLPGQIPGAPPGQQGTSPGAGASDDRGPGQVGMGAATRSGFGMGSSAATTPGQTLGPTAGAAVTTGAGGRGGIIGVASKSSAKSIRLYKGRGRYNEWQFVYTEATKMITPTQEGQQPGGFNRPGGGARGTPRPGMQPGTRPTPGGTNRLPFGSRPGSGTPPGSQSPN